MSSLNRREFLAGAGAVASSVAMGRGVGDFAGKLFYISKEAKKNPYVTDGLVAWLDGFSCLKSMLQDDYLGCEFMGSPSFHDDEGYVNFSNGAYALGNKIDTNGWDGFTLEACHLNRSVSTANAIGFGYETSSPGLKPYFWPGNNLGSYNSYTYLPTLVKSNSGFIGPNTLNTFATVGISYDYANQKGSLFCGNKTITKDVASNSARIGNSFQINAPAWHTAGSGNIDVYSVRLYNRALTPDEIAANYAIDKERFCL